MQYFTILFAIPLVMHFSLMYNHPIKQKENMYDKRQTHGQPLCPN